MNGPIFFISPGDPEADHRRYLDRLAREGRLEVRRSGSTRTSRPMSEAEGFRALLEGRDITLPSGFVARNEDVWRFIEASIEADLAEEKARAVIQALDGVNPRGTRYVRSDSWTPPSQDAFGPRYRAEHGMEEYR